MAAKNRILLVRLFTGCILVSLMAIACRVADTPSPQVSRASSDSSGPSASSEPSADAATAKEPPLEGPEDYISPEPVGGEPEAVATPRPAADELEAPAMAETVDGHSPSPPAPIDSGKVSTDVSVSGVAPAKDEEAPAKGSEAHDESPAPPPPRPDDLQVEARTLQKAALVLSLEPARGGAVVKTALDLPDESQETDLSLNAEADGVVFSLLKYVPSLAIEEAFAPAAPGEPASPAMRLLLKATGRTWDTWMVPGSRILGRAAMQSAIVEYIPSLSPADLRTTESFVRELYGRVPKILLEVKRDRRRFILPATAGQTGVVEEPQYRVEVVRALNCFGLDSSTGDAVDQDVRPLNPAVQVRVTHAGKTRTTWLFSQLPEFSRDAEDEDATLRYVWNLRGHPHPRANIVVVDAEEGPLTALVALEGEVYSLELRPAVPARVSTLELTVAERIPAARVQQKMRADLQGAPAVLVAWKVQGKDIRQWVPVGATEELNAGNTIAWARLEKPRSGDATRKTGPHGERAPTPGLPLGHPSLRGEGPKLPPGHPAIGPPLGPPKNDSATGSGKSGKATEK